MDLLPALALLGIGLLAGYALGVDTARPAPPPGPVWTPYAPERHAGCTPPAPYLIIRADDPGAPVEYHR